MPEIKTAHDLFVHNLKSIYYLEQRLRDELDGLAGEVTNDDLAEALQEHRKETVDQVERLEKVFEKLGEEIEGHRAADFHGHFKEIKHLNEDIHETDMLNIAFLDAAIKTEQMEITTYNSLIRMVDNLAVDNDIENLLKDNLHEEKEALEKLRKLAGETWFSKIVKSLT
ncbi:MAG: hypothetical protein BRC30_01615 [Nanohaloarchaea archaeon SW_7_46_7]|nr:MAG: hypothetical protein BRC30_01615 [Nanohaloarchaea archaeon SW_7_46_7]